MKRLQFCTKIHFFIQLFQLMYHHVFLLLLTMDHKNRQNDTWFDLITFKHGLSHINVISHYKILAFLLDVIVCTISIILFSAIKIRTLLTFKSIK